VKNGDLVDQDNVCHVLWKSCPKIWDTYFSSSYHGYSSNVSIFIIYSAPSLNRHLLCSR